MLDQESVNFLKKNELFSNFSETELAPFLPLISVIHFEKDHLIFNEGDRGSDVYLIKRGRVEILTEDREHGGSYTLATLEPNNCFGEMNILNNNVRMASSKTLENTEVLVLDLTHIRELAEKDPLFSRLLLNLAKQASQHLRRANDLAIQSAKTELNLIKIHDQMGKFIIHLFILLTFYFYILKIFEEFNSDSTLIRLVSAALIFCFTLSGILLVRTSGFPLAFYGLTLKNWKKNASESALFTLPVLLLMIFTKWALISTVPEFKKLPLVQIGEHSHSFFNFFGSSEHQTQFYTLLGLYILFVPLQEFIARGCLQSCLYNFFQSSNRAILAILTSNLLFGLFHGLKSFTFVGVAFFLGLFWGWIYQRQRSIVGPSISHAMIGAWGFGVLNFQSLLIY